MKILAFDTTNSTLSVAILFGKQLVAKKDIFAANKQAEMLLPAIEECLNQAEIWYQDLNLIALTNGPGSFTGIRIGCSCAKALEIATKLPVITFSSLEAIAYNYRLGTLKNKAYQRIFIANDARMEEFFIQEFKIQNNSIEAVFLPKMITAADINKFLPQEKFLLAGSAKKIILEQLKPNINQPETATKTQFTDLANIIFSTEIDFIDSYNIALLATQKFLAQNQENSQALYIRKPQISQRKLVKKSQLNSSNERINKQPNQENL